jgi:hypothetical protein
VAMRRAVAALAWLPHEDTEMAFARDLELALAAAGTGGAVAAVAGAATSLTPAPMAIVASTFTAAATARHALGLTKPNAVEAPQVCVCV